MLAVRQADDAAEQARLVAYPEKARLASSAEADITGPELHQTELKRKQGLRSIQYWYKGKPVAAGPFAQSHVATAQAPASRNK